MPFMTFITDDVALPHGPDVAQAALQARPGRQGLPAGGLPHGPMVVAQARPRHQGLPAGGLPARPGHLEYNGSSYFFDGLHDTASKVDDNTLFQRFQEASSRRAATVAEKKQRSSRLTSTDDDDDLFH